MHHGQTSIPDLVYEDSLHENPLRENLANYLQVILLAITPWEEELQEVNEAMYENSMVEIALVPVSIELVGLWLMVQDLYG